MKKTNCISFGSVSFLLTFLMVFIFGSGIHFSFAKDDNSKDKKAETKKSKKTKQGPQGTSITVSPSLFILDCRGGEKQTISLKVENINNNPINISINAIGKIIKGGTLDEISIASLPPNNLARHIVIESPAIQLPANGQRNVSVTLDVPPGLTGTQYAGLIVANTSEFDLENVDSRTSEYQTQLGVGLLPASGLTIKCNMVDTLQYSYSLQKLISIPGGANAPSTVKVVLKNTGNAELVFLPIIVLTDSSGKVVARLKGESQTYLVPSATGEIQMAPLFTKIPPGKYKAVLTLAGLKSPLPPVEQTVMIQ